jgi:hypothetical protein
MKMTTKERIEAASKAGWTHIRTERSYADGIPPGSAAPHPFGAHNYQELPSSPNPPTHQTK